MRPNETIDQLLTELGFNNITRDDKKRRSDFRKHLLHFIEKKCVTKKTFLDLDNSQIQHYADRFLNEEEGAHCLTELSNSDKWQTDLSLTKERIFELAKKEVKSARAKSVRSKSKLKQPKQTNSRVEQGSTATQGPFITLQMPSQNFPSDRLSHTAIDATALEDETGSRSDRAIADEESTDGLPDIKEICGTRREAVPSPRTVRDYWSADTEPDRTIRECTEETVDTAGDIPANKPLTPRESMHAGLMSPPTTRPRFARPREEDAEVHSPAIERPTKRVSHRSEDDRSARGPDANEETSPNMRSDDHYQEVAIGGRAGTPTISDPPIPSAPYSQGPVSMNPPRTSCLLNSCVMILSQEVQLTHEDLAKSLSLMMKYLQQCGQHLTRKSNTDILGADERANCREKSRLLREIQNEIALQIMDIARGRVSDGEADEPIISSFLL